MPEPTAPRTDLPVEEVVDHLRAVLREQGVAVLEASPGAGKTTVVPLRLLHEPWLAGKRIVVLEPRRVAARAAARRMADLVGGSVGGLVGYRTRDDAQTGPRTRIEVVTEGILVRQLQDDPWLEGVGLVVLDEVHERNLTTDLALALLVDVRREARPDLRVLAMSATVEAERLAEALGDAAAPAPVVRAEGRAFPVEVRHAPPGPGDRLDAHVARTVARLLATEAGGDVLVFLPGAADIGRVRDRLDAPGAVPAEVEVVRLFGALSADEQDRALAGPGPGRRRVVLSTDLAESSLTVPGVRLVVDAGLVRVPRHDPTTGLTRLRTEPASQASADQRAGRAGRLGPGVAVRAWDPADAARRPRWPVPEIEVTDLAALALEVAVWGTAPADLALPDPPPRPAWAAAHDVLVALGAVDHAGRPTARGRAMAALPLHPRLAALALAGVDREVGWTGAVLAAVLEEGDVLRGHPAELPADVAVRVALVGDDDARHPDADRRALRSVRRRAAQVARRLGVRARGLDLDAVGWLVAAAHPERIAQAQGGGGYRLRGGGGAALVGTDALAPSRWLAVARVDDGPRGPEIRLAAHLEGDDVEALVADDAVVDEEVAWDEGRGDVRARRRRRSGALVLDESEGPAEPGPATTAVLLDRVRQGELLRWTDAARALQARLGFLHRLDPAGWPDVSDEALLATLDDWLVPMVPGLRSADDLRRVDLVAALGAGLDHQRRRALDRLAPTTLDLPSGRTVRLDYRPDGPRLSTRAQDLYGLAVHPTVAGGTVPVVVELLSPARRPIQVTSDLPGFWAGSWAEVRKEMAGRYPKHDWPVDPS